MKSTKLVVILVAAVSVVVCAGCRAGSRQGRPISEVDYSQAREAAVEHLLELSGNERPQVRANAIEALSRVPGRAFDVIEGGLRDPNEGVRSVSAMVVGRAGLSDAAGWVKALERDRSAFVRASAIYALDRVGQDVDPSPLASTLLRSSSIRERAHAAFVLGELGDPSALGLLREAGATGMARASPSDLKLLRLQIAEAMIKLGDEVPLQAVRAALYPARPEDLEGAALAVQIIGEVGDHGAVDQLIFLSQGKDESDRPMPAEVRLATAGALAVLGYPQGGFLADEYAEHESEAIRAQAAWVYGRIGDVANLGKLQRLMQDPSPSVRAAAAGAILRLGSPG